VTGTTRLGGWLGAWMRQLGRFLIGGSTEGCCTCGGPRHDYLYWGACDYGDPSLPDWGQCAACHDGTDEHAVWLRSLHWEAR
jgi:hypothetical protein